jgi:hypothetical protein
MRYVRWPASFIDDSIFSPPLLPRMLTKPARCAAASCGGHDLSQGCSFGALHQRDDFGHLVASAACGLLATFLGWRAFFAGLAFLAAVRLPVACGAFASGVFSVSIAFVRMVFLLVTVVTSITPAGRNSNQNLRR